METFGCSRLPRVPTIAGRRVLGVEPGGVVPAVRVGREVTPFQTLGAVAAAGGAVAGAAETETNTGG